MIISKKLFLILTYTLYQITYYSYAYDQLKLSAKDVSKEQELIWKLMKNYSKKQKPTGTVHIKFALNLNQVVNVRAKDQIFTLNVFVDHEWIDSRLIWNPAENGNISVLRISSEYLWTPDTFIYTIADSAGFLSPQAGAYFVVGNNGKIFWPNPLPEMKVRCKMDIAWFPYDEQVCTLVFGSWSNTMTYLNYTFMNENTTLFGYIENNEWALKGYKAYRKVIKYDNWIENDPFSEIHYKIYIRRKPLFVLQNYCIPTLMLCVITLCSFFMPFAQEMQLGISIMLSFSILKLKLSEDVPSQSDSMPLFNIYFLGCMFFSLFAMIWFFIMSMLNDQKKLSKAVRCLVLKFICGVMFINNYKTVVSKRSTAKKQTISENEIISDRIELEESGLERIVTLSDKEVLEILNQFVFYLFLIFIILLNIVCLVIFPYIIKTATVLPED